MHRMLLISLIVRSDDFLCVFNILLNCLFEFDLPVAEVNKGRAVEAEE